MLLTFVRMHWVLFLICYEGHWKLLTLNLLGLGKKKSKDKQSFYFIYNVLHLSLKSPSSNTLPFL